MCGSRDPIACPTSPDSGLSLGSAELVAVWNQLDSGCLSLLQTSMTGSMKDRHCRGKACRPGVLPGHSPPPCRGRRGGASGAPVYRSGWVNCCSNKCPQTSTHGTGLFLPRAARPLEVRGAVSCVVLTPESD